MNLESSQYLVSSDDTFSNRLGNLLVGCRCRVVVISLLVALISGMGIVRLRITHDPDIFFRPTDPAYQAFLRFESLFEHGEPLLFALDASGGSFFEAPLSRAVQVLTELAWDLPYADHVLSLANLPVVNALGDDLSLNTLFSVPDGLDVLSPAQLQEIAIAHRAPALRLMSESGSVAGIVVTLSIPPHQGDAAPQIARAARSLIATFERAFPDIKVYVGGAAIITDAFGAASLRDLRTLIPLSLLCILVILAISLRSLPALLVAKLVVLLALVTGLGMAGWFGIPLSAVSISGPVLIITLAVADAVHLLRCFLRFTERGVSGKVAGISAIRVNLTPMLLTSATTAVGFFCLNFSPSPPLQHLGNVVGMGVIAAFFFALCLVPTLASWFPARGNCRASPGTRMADWLADKIQVYPLRILWLFLGVAGIGSLGLAGISFHDNLIEYFGVHTSVRRDAAFIGEHLGGTKTIDYVVTSRNAENILQPQQLAIVDRLAQWQAQRPDVQFSYAITDTLRHMHASWEGPFALPPTPELAAQLLMLYELALPPGQYAHTWITMDRDATRVQVGLGKQNTREMLEFEARTAAWVTRHVPESLAIEGTGQSLLWARITHRNMYHMLMGTALALLLVSVMVAVSLRDPKLGVISLVPNLLPPLIAFGIWGLLSLRVGLALSAVGSMTIGIVVDDTLYFMFHYNRQRRLGGASPAAAIRTTLQMVGGALCTTTFALVAGFLVLGFSAYRMSSQVGVLCAMVFLLALVFDLVLLPALLILGDRD
ncbi:MAG: efflux RND transporter permease subunit [Kiritimatiellia bacterium]